MSNMRGIPMSGYGQNYYGASLGQPGAASSQNRTHGPGAGHSAWRGQGMGRRSHGHWHGGRDRWMGGGRDRAMGGGRYQGNPQQFADQLWAKIDPSGSATITQAQFEQYFEQQAQQWQSQQGNSLVPPSPGSSSGSTTAVSISSPTTMPTTAPTAGSAATSGSPSAASPSSSSAPTDPATLQQEVVSQIQQYEQSSEYTGLSSTDQQAVQQTLSAVQGLDPTDPAFMTNLTSILGYDPTTGQPAPSPAAGSSSPSTTGA